MNGNRRPLILIVEDNPANLLLATSVLERDDMEVVSAGTARAARDLIAALPPDLVLMDVMLPDGDGFELTRELKTAPSTASTPIVALTARAFRADEEAAAAAGCDGFISKPVDTRTLADQVRRFLPT
jgi:CheY-like chemotaxis protein